MPEKLLKILRFIIICCLIFSFVVQILESFEKFLAGRSSFSTRMELKVQTWQPELLYMSLEIL